MSHNPFPGPQPYRSADRDRFFGREEMAYRLGKNLLGHRCVTVYGPSGAGKSSVVQAAVIPSLIASHAISVVRVDAWPADVDPTLWLADTLYADLDLGPRPPDLAPDEAVLLAAQRVARRSTDLALIYLDQIEQLLYGHRSAEASEAFFACLGRLVELPLRNIRVVFSLREDYLGRFRDRLRDYRRLLDHGFRVGPLLVGELAEAVCQAAASGEPPQRWELSPIQALMLQVRVPGQAETYEAEAQAAYAQIVCRALFQQREGGAETLREGDAELILRGYLDATLVALGHLEKAAQRLLEEHLIAPDGSRTLRTENELLRLLPAAELRPILKALEDAAILHAEEHQGSRYFEIGHDWLARRVFEQRKQREFEEEQRRNEEEQRRAQLLQQQEAEAMLAKARRGRRRLLGVTSLSLTIAVSAGALGVWAWQQKQAAEQAQGLAEQQKHLAEQREREATQAQQSAEEQRQLSERLEHAARAAKGKAEAEAQKALDAALAARRARDEAKRSEQLARAAEAAARAAEGEARAQEQKATQAAEQERRSKEALERLIERAAGKITDRLK
jgi:hypothetical protein